MMLTHKFVAYLIATLAFAEVGSLWCFVYPQRLSSYQCKIIALRSNPIQINLIYQSLKTKFFNLCNPMVALADDLASS